jgi:hypothetical protein
MAHSPEPWRVKKVAGCDYVHDANGVNLEKENADGFELRNIGRIVACVNALAGVPTEKLENLEGCLPDGQWHSRQPATNGYSRFGASGDAT